LAIPLWLVSLALAAGVVVLLVNIPPEVPASADPVVFLLLAVAGMVARIRPRTRRRFATSPNWPERQ
jgi:hypothetical protein